ncbi:MAG TPA: hypothetical protein VKZ63_12490, partial [Kofleriaceae bacterium]|nr:hypothetical protein [Kofleriaceae bacterium]
MRASAWLLLAAACGACGRCSSDPEDTASPRLGRALAAGVTQAVAASGALREPFRCAEPDPLVPLLPADPSFAGAAAGRPLTIDRDVLRIGPRARRTDRTLVVGVVADARGARQETLAQLGVARTAFSEEKVELVVSLGGMGTSEEEIAAVLGALIAEAP